MPLKTLVKVGCITNLSDARYCAGMGVDFLGFRVMEGDQHFITPKAYQEIRGWITGPQIVAEVYGINRSEELTQIIENYRPDYIELSLKELKVIGATLQLPFILSMQPTEILPPDLLQPAYIITSLHAEHMEKIIPDHEVLLSATEANDLKEILPRTGIAGVALNGGMEIRPGLKNFDDLAEILEMLETED